MWGAKAQGGGVPTTSLGGVAETSSAAVTARKGYLEKHSFSFVGSSVQLSEVLLVCANACLMEYVWLVFGSGLCDPPVGQGYLHIGIIVSLVVTGILALCMLRGSAFFETLKHHQATTLAVGVACSVTTIPLLTVSSSLALSSVFMWAVSIVNYCSIAWLIFLCSKSLCETASSYKVSLMMHLCLIAVAIVHGVVYLLGEKSAPVVFPLLPTLGALLLLSAAWSRYGKRNADAGFWLVASTTARERDAWPHSSHTFAAEHPSPELQRVYRRMLASLAAFCFFIAFVRFHGIAIGESAQAHAVGSAPAITVMALVGFVMANVTLFMHRFHWGEVYYLVSGLGMFFAALILLIPANSNFLIVRVIENVSYILYFFSVVYALTTYARRYRFSPSRVFSTAAAVICFANAAGWLTQVLLGELGVSQTYGDVVTLVLLIVLLVFFFVVFSPFSYRMLVTEAVPTDHAVTLSQAQDIDAAVQGAFGADGNEEAALDEGMVTGDERTLDVNVPDEGASDDAVGAAVTVDAATAAGAAVPLDGEGSAVVEPAEVAAGCASGPDAEGVSSTEGKLPPRHRRSFRASAALVAQSSGLSKRETEILFMLIKGWSDQRIADELVLSYHTVRSHVRHIYVKVDVHNREELLNKIGARQDEE